MRVVPVSFSRARWLLALLAALLMTWSCGGDDVSPPPGDGPPVNPPDNPPDNPPITPPGVDRPTGATDFVSADAQAGQDSSRNDAPTAGEPTEDFDTDGGGERTVEEGDIYRVLDGDLIVNLNAYRGLQIIDFSDVDDPRIIGRLQIAGYPVEAYVVGNHAFVLMNNWRGYSGSLYDYAVEALEGGVVLAVDVTDPTNPVELDWEHIPGYIQTSRVTRGGGQAALYVVTSHSGQFDGETWETRTLVKSFDISDGTLEPKSELNLGGYVTDIQATTEALLVARYDWNYNEQQSRVALVDISDPGGTMIEGDEVEVMGYVADQFKMDLYQDVLRVASGSRWGGSGANHIQTFDASDFSQLTPIDHVDFAPNEDLYATLFLRNKAFCVTYLRVDPFHAFSIDDNGIITEESEFIVSGWNDFFRAVLDETRLIGIGMNDEEGRAAAVSLYDITDMSNPTPLVARAGVEADYSWSEANWDHRAFSVIEGAVEALAETGETETGLVLLPFSGWSDHYDTYTAAVQIFTFSATTLTRRGLMVHGTPVRRSFLADEDEHLAANLSEAELSFFDVEDPGQPEEKGRVELAPNYTDVLRYGDYNVRVKNSRDHYYWWWGGGAELPPAAAEIVPTSEHPDTGEAVASIEIPSDAQVYQTGDLLVVVAMRFREGSVYPDYVYDSEIAVWDLSDPAHPSLAGTFTTDRLRPSYNYYWGWAEDCWDCGYAPWYYGTNDDVEGIPGGLVFLQRHDQQELLGTEHVCSTYPTVYSTCVEGPGGTVTGDGDCVYYQGSIQCRSLEGEEPYCTGAISECHTEGESNEEWVCTEVDPATIETTENCWDYERYRYWQSFTLEVLDLRDPTAPELIDTIEVPEGNEGVSMLVDGGHVWISYRQPYDVEGDSRPYVRYYIQDYNLGDIGDPAVGEVVNVPGELLAKDGNEIITRDLVWGEDVVETAVARLELFEGLAYLQAIRVFEDRVVNGIALDGVGHVFVSHQLAWQIAYERGLSDNVQVLSVLDAIDDDLSVMSEVPVDTWAELRTGQAGRALFQVPGGLLVFNVDDPEVPYPQAYFPTRGWPTEIYVVDRDILFAGGPYGIYLFGLDTFNLLAME